MASRRIDAMVLTGVRHDGAVVLGDQAGESAGSMNSGDVPDDRRPISLAILIG
jgi:hypothetical protein